MGSCTQKASKNARKPALNPLSTSFLNDHSVIVQQPNTSAVYPSAEPLSKSMTKSPPKLQQTQSFLSEGSTASLININDVYRFGEVIGKGTFGKVRLAENAHGKIFAVKSIEKSLFYETKTSQDRLYLLRRELTIMKSVDHPNLVKFYETYHDEKYFHFVMEYADGIDLWEFIERRLLPAGRTFSEKQVAIIMRQLFNAVAYLHTKSIIHRDLKPQNIIVNEATLHVKILDFGLSRKAEWSTDENNNTTTNKLFSMVGTPLFVAPEMIKEQPYDEKVDIWSLGILMFYMLSCGQYPFENDSIKTLFLQICFRDVAFTGSKWAAISWNAKDLIKSLLTVEPDERINLKNATEHAWFDAVAREKRRKIQMIDTKIQACVQNVLSFHSKTKLKHEILKIAFNMTIKDISILRKAFEAISIKGLGMISAKEMVHAAKEMHLPVQEAEVNALFKEINSKGSECEFENPQEISEKEQSIGYSDFMLAAMDLKQVLNQQNVESLFAFFDKDSDGNISAADLEKIFAQEGRKLSTETIEGIIKEIDIDNNGSISKSNFFGLLEAEVNAFVKTRTSFSNFDSQ